MVRSKKYSEVNYSQEPVLKTGDIILDEFISNDNGFVIGSSIFLTGTSGAGKTTFAFTLQKVFEKYVTSLYSREMSAGAVKQQMNRYAISHENAFIADKETCPTVNDYINELNVLKPRVVIVDSLQVITKEDYEDMSEEKAAYDVIKILREWVEQNDAVLIMVGHVNKDGSFEGKNTIKHMFDAHLEMIFDEKKNTRTVSWSKNRKGPIGMLYYEFGKEKINFLTPSQWDAKDNKKDLSKFVYDAMINFLSTYKGTDNYTILFKEVNKEIARISTLNYATDIEMVCEMTKSVQKIVNEFKV